MLTDDNKQKEVRTNKFSVGGLIGVYANTIVK